MNRHLVAAKGISFRAKTTLRLFLAVLKRGRDAGVTIWREKNSESTQEVRKILLASLEDTKGTVEM